MLNRAVADFVASRLPGAEVIVSGESTASSHEAASAVGSHVEGIGKTIVFASKEKTALVLISAAKRVSRAKLRETAGDPRLKIADPLTVTERTGYAVGGVSPLVLPEGVELFVDRGLFGLACVWVSAGSPNSVVKLSPEHLTELFANRSFDLAEEPAS